MATEHTAVGVRRKVKLLVHISGRPLVVSWSDLQSRTLPGRKSATIASNGAFPDAREREVYQTSAPDSVGGFLKDVSWRVCAMKMQQAVDQSSTFVPILRELPANSNPWYKHVAAEKSSRNG